MKSPRPRGTAIDLKRIRRWANEFGSYRHAVGEDRIREWLKQFKSADQDLAARILDCVEFYTHDQIAGAFKAVLRGLPGWNEDEAQRKGKWRFVPYSMSAGESGGVMTAKFRHANNL